MSQKVTAKETLQIVVPSVAKYPLPPKVADFAKKNFFALSRYMLC